MNIKEFDSIFDFIDVVTTSLKEYDGKFNDFCKACKKYPNTPCYFFIYEFKNRRTNKYILHCFYLCGSLEDCESVFNEDDRVICTINQDFKIENYCIKKA